MRHPTDPGEVWMAVRKKRPLVYQLTSAVAAAFQAEVTAAVGASSVMSAHSKEARVIASAADALLLNTGMPNDASVESFNEALAGLPKGRPCLLDPVGYGVSPWRTAWIDAIVSGGRVTALKGNGAEMARLGGTGGRLRGVESSKAPKLEEAMARIAKMEGAPSVAIATGATDMLAEGGMLWKVRGGSSFLPLLPASGCALGSVAAACLCVAEPLSACLAALLAFRMAAERAEGSPWPASWKNAFLDALAALEPDELSEGMRSRTEGPLEFCKEAE